MDISEEGVLGLKIHLDIQVSYQNNMTHPLNNQTQKESFTANKVRQILSQVYLLSAECIKWMCGCLAICFIKL